MYDKSALDLKDILSPTALKISPNIFSLGGKSAKTLFIISYPKFLDDGWLTPIINLDQEVDVSLHIKPISTEKILRTFQKKVAEVESQIIARERSGHVRDPSLDQARSNLEELRDKLQQSQEKLFDIGLYITFYADDELKLKKIENEIKNILNAKLIYFRPSVFQQEQGFISTIPILMDKLEVYNKLNSAPLSSSFPFVSFDLTSQDGILYGINRHNGGLILFDRFSLPNYNSVTFASSGSGKSFATKLEIIRTLMFGTSVIVIDPEKEYELLSETLGGQFINISLNTGNFINPFDLPSPQKDETREDILRSNIIGLVSLFRNMLNGLTSEEDALLDQAVTQVYALKDITPETDFENLEPPLLSDLELVLQGFENSESILSRLSKYTTGSWSGFLNNATNISLEKDLVVFCIRDMEDELKQVAMFIITRYIWNSVRRKLKKRLLIVEEAWIMMKSVDTASFLFSMAKRGRKYYFGLSTITQDVGDFLKSDYGVPILTNSSMQLLLKQSATTIDTLQQTFNLTQEEKYLLLESGVGEGIFFADQNHVAIKIVASFTEQKIITSNPEDIIRFQQERRESNLKQI